LRAHQCKWQCIVIILTGGGNILTQLAQESIHIVKALIHLYMRGKVFRHTLIHPQVPRHFWLYKVEVAYLFRMDVKWRYNMEELMGSHILDSGAELLCRHLR